MSTETAESDARDNGGASDASNGASSSNNDAETKSVSPRISTVATGATHNTTIATAKLRGRSTAATAGLPLPTRSLRSRTTIHPDESLSVAERERPLAGAASKSDSTSYVKRTTQADKSGKGGERSEGGAEEESDMYAQAQLTFRSSPG